jgi:Tol biopolymer transport system component
MRGLVFVLIVLLAFACNGGGEEGLRTATPAPSPTATATPAAMRTVRPPPPVTVTPTPTPTPIPSLEPVVEGTETPSGCLASLPNPSEAPVDLGEPTRYARGIYSIGLDGSGLSLLADNPGPGPIPPGPTARAVSYSEQTGRAVFLAEGRKLYLVDLQARTPPQLLASLRYITDFALSQDGASVLVDGGYGDQDDALFLVSTATGALEPLPLAFSGPAALAWSPSGDRLAVVGIRQQEQPPAVFILRPDGSDLMQVGEDWQATAWSPDGLHLAFGGPQGIHVADLEGNVAKVSDTGLSTLAWSPDGRCIAFTGLPQEGEEPPIKVLDTETGWEVLLTKGTHPVWSPDGSRIAFLRDDNLWVMNIDGSQQTRLTNPRQPFVQEPFWLSDGPRLLFAYVPPMAESVYLINPDGSGEVSLADGYGPVFSPDGSRIAFYGGGIFGGLGALVDIYVMNSDGRRPAKIAQVHYGDVVPPCTGGGSRIAWSADGRFLAYAGNVNGVEVVPSDGSAPAWQLGGSSLPSWAPGEHRLASSSYKSEGGAPGSCYVVLSDLETDQTSTLTEGERPSWSPDGQRIAFYRDEAVYLIDVSGTSERKLLELTSDALVDLAWSPDGSRLAVATDGLYVIDVDSGEGEKLADDARDPVWSPDGMQLAFTFWEGGGPSESPAVYVVNADGSGQPRKLTDGSGPSWSPDGLSIAFAR